MSAELVRETSSSGAADHRFIGWSGTPTVNVGDRVRVTIEGDVYAQDSLGLKVRDDTGGVHWLVNSIGVEVLVPADPPLEPGDLVRDDRGRVYIYAPPPVAGNAGTGAASFSVLLDANGRQASELLCNYKRADLSGPLVKVELREVSGG